MHTYIHFVHTFIYVHMFYLDIKGAIDHLFLLCEVPAKVPLFCPCISCDFYVTFKFKGCYAPNGFHAEKPVICALSVDNRMLTVFKEEKGRRKEIENVEVKLFEVGMFVYDLHTSGHDFVTDELWAAFYKMLLEKRLVPRIVLSPESPGFDWIRNFATPGQ